MISYELAACYIRIVNSENGQSRISQVDYDYPGIAASFGWHPRRVQPSFPEECPHKVKTIEYQCPRCGLEIEARENDREGCTGCHLAFGELMIVKENEPDLDPQNCQQCFDTEECEHARTDGTVDCPDCGTPAGEFISDAYDFLLQHEGEEVEDPGYW